MYKKGTKKNYVTHKQTTTTELQAPDLRQAHTYHAIVFKVIKVIKFFPIFDFLSIMSVY